MKTCNLLMLEKRATKHILSIACAAALAGSVSLPRPALADYVMPPPVPDNIQVPADNKAFLAAHAFGTQNYVCLPSGSSFAWTFFSPQATLFNRDDQQVITHFLSPNPEESDTARVAWQHSRDSSIVWGKLVESSSDPAFVAPGAIPWLKVEKAGVQVGPTGGHKLTSTTFIQRVNTSGGSAPLTGCTAATDVGKKALVHYSADYFFYKSAESRD